MRSGIDEEIDQVGAYESSPSGHEHSGVGAAYFHGSGRLGNELGAAHENHLRQWARNAPMMRPAQHAQVSQYTATRAKGAL